MKEKKKIRKNPIPLIVEKHPVEYDGYPFITLVQYHDKDILAIIDDSNDKIIKGYVLDLCSLENVNEQIIIDVTSEWYESKYNIYPISFEFSKRNIITEASKIYRIFNVEYVTRVIGPLPRFEMSKVHSIRRRKKKEVPNGVRIHNIQYKE